MDRPNFVTPSAPMLPDEPAKVPGKLNGRILIREDTILTKGCVGCGRQFACTGAKQSWSALCWGPQTDKKYYCLLILLSATFVLSLIGTIFFCFTNTINDAILSSMVIRNNSVAYGIWRRPNVQPKMKVHIFNYSNWEEVRLGKADRLEVREMGPYTYSQQLERVNIRFQHDTLTYQERNHFKYLPEETVGAHFDQIYVPNLPLLGVLNMASRMLLYWQQALLNSALGLANHREAFVKLPVHRFLWGYNDDIINSAKPFLSFSGQLKFREFGLLATKNGTVSERFTINTGEVNKDLMNILQKVDGQPNLPYWDGEECNSIAATDGTIFPPSMLDKKQTLYIFMPNLCRRLPFVFDTEVKISNGVVLYRYRIPDDAFDDPVHNPSNQCYCEMDTGTCPPRGVINVTACTMGAPAMVSFPHFYLGDPKLREDIAGMRPDKAKHETFVDIHPTLGIALQGQSSLQINMQVRKTPQFTSMSFLDEGLILPVAWIEMVVPELPESLKSLVYHGTYSTVAVQLGLKVICLLTLIISSLCLVTLVMQRRQKRKRQICGTVKMVPGWNFQAETKQES